MAISAKDVVMALDIGTRRIGVAVASGAVLIARSLETILNDNKVYEQIQRIIDDEHVTVLVVGLPRGLEGQDTQQTRLVQDFVTKMQEHVKVAPHWQDEALTSRKAEEELNRRGKPYAKGDVDALAATYILEDFLTEQEKKG